MAGVRKNTNADTLLAQAGQFAAAGQRAAAISALRKAIGLKPDFADAYALLGLQYYLGGNPQAAHDCYRKALQLSPDNHPAWLNLGVLFHALGRYADAERCYREVVRLQPDHVDALFELGSVLQSQRRHPEAVEYLLRAKTLAPQRIRIHTKLADILLTLGEFDATAELRDELCDLLERVRARKVRAPADLHMLIFYLPYLSMGGYPARLLARDFEKTLPAPAFRHTADNNAGNRRIRLGYLSPHFGNQPISHVTRGLYALHDRDRFEVICYSLMDRSNDPGTYLQDIKAGCDRFVDLSRDDIQQAARRIHADGIDILIDLNGYMPGSQLPIVSQRPAPVQVYWLGHGGGLGLSCLDYVIADATVVPPGEEAFYTEKVARLPEIYHSTDRPPVAATCPPRSHYGLAEDAFVFCAFNNQIKIDQRVFDTWMRILGRVPGSQLWLSNLQQLDSLAGNFRAQARKRGIDPERLVFASGELDKSVHLARHRLADLFLDAFSYNASTTTIDALWAGLPVLTLQGDYFQSRIAASMLKNAGLEDMICTTEQDYEDRAVALAGDPGRLTDIRTRLEGNRDTRPLFDTRRYVAHLEAAYTTMWERHRQGLAPAGFDIAPIGRDTGTPGG